MTMPVHKTPPDYINGNFVHKESVQADPGDMLWLDPADSYKAKPASSLSDQGSDTLNQALFASLFAGFSLSQQLSTDSTARGARILTEGDIELTCESATFAPGDFVTPTDTAGVLSDQSVQKTTDETLAIGKVIKRYSSSTTKVWVRFKAPLLTGPSSGGGGASADITGTPGDAAGDAGGTATITGGAGAPHTTGTAGAGGAASGAGGAGGLATSGTGGAGGAGSWKGGAGGTATTGTAGAGGANTASAGAGGEATAAAGAGGAGGALTASGGTGGAASHASGGAAGAGGAVTTRGGAGGAAAGTGAAVGGAGGAWSGGGGVGGTAAGTSAGGAGGAVTLSSGTGGAKTGTGAASGGVGGAIGITSGDGGATASSGSDAGGAAGTITITGGAGGAASAGTGNGGAGGSIVLVPGAGGTSSGGTAGARGTVTATGFIAKSAQAAAITTTRTLTAADSGGIFSVAKTSAYAITLPTPQQGLKFKFLVIDTGANIVTISDGSAHLLGTVSVNNVNTAMTGTTLSLASGGSVGDWVEFEGISSTQYLVTGACIAAADITIA
jgi:hypothetical protein